MTPDQSYFSSSSTYSTIPVTPSTAAPSPSLRTPTNTPITATSNQTLDQEMLNRFAAFFPPPPTPSLSTPRNSASVPASPQILTSHRCPAPPSSSSSSHSSSTHLPNMDVSSSIGKHTMHVQLPFSIKPEMITITANRGDKLRIVADAWHMQQECESSQLDSYFTSMCNRSFTSWCGFFCFVLI